MTRIAEEGYITPQLAFISYFVQTLVESTSIKTKIIMKPLLSLIPPALVNLSMPLNKFEIHSFIKFFLFSFTVILHVGNLARFNIHFGRC